MIITGDKIDGFIELDGQLILTKRRCSFWGHWVEAGFKCGEQGTARNGGEDHLCWMIIIVAGYNQS